MKTFPMFLKMEGRRVVIAGGGEQAAQKCRLMLKTEAKIEVLAEALDPELQSLFEAGKISWRKGPIKKTDFADTALTFVATGCPGIDAALHAIAKDAGATVNVVDQPDLCDALTPSIVDRDPVVVAIGTEGTAPVLARQIKTKLEQALEPRLGDLAALAGRLRSMAAQRLAPRARRDLWRWVFNGEVRETHARGAQREAAEMIKTAITDGLPDSNAGSVSLVGAGPGSRDLITLRGVQRLQEADIIFYDRLIDPDILELARRDAERIYVGKAPGCHSWPQEKISQMLVGAARKGQRVVRLKCGDPGIFARGAEEAEALKTAGIDFEIVPGVTAASACAASSGTFLTERNQIDTLVLTTGTAAQNGLPPDWISYLNSGARLAVYMGVHAAKDICDQMKQAGLGHEIEVEITSHGDRPNRRRFSCKGSELAKLVVEENVENPAIIFLTRPKTAARPSLKVVS